MRTEPKQPKPRTEAQIASQFKPGHVKTGGRVKGQPTQLDQFRSMCRQYTGECVAYMVEQMRGRTNHAFAACEFLMQMGHGKPAQQLNLGNPDGTPLDFSGLDSGRLTELLARIDSYLQQGDGTARPLGDPSGTGQASLH